MHHWKQAWNTLGHFLLKAHKSISSKMCTQGWAHISCIVLAWTYSCIKEMHLFIVCRAMATNAIRTSWQLMLASCVYRYQPWEVSSEREGSKNEDSPWIWTEGLPHHNALSFHGTPHECRCQAAILCPYDTCFFTSPCWILLDCGRLGLCT